jgi:hypothetical protein
MNLIFLSQNILLQFLAFAHCLFEHCTRITSEVCALSFGYCIWISLFFHPMLYIAIDEGFDCIV